MEATLEHVQDRWLAYLVLAACLAPVIYLTRRHTVPVLLWALEVIAYSAAFHLIVHGAVRVFRWFKINSTMYHREKVDPEWSTPLLEFWRRELYNPQWVIYLEIVFVIAVIAYIIKYRPLRIQPPPPKRTPLRKGVGPTGVSTPMGGRGGRR